MGFELKDSLSYAVLLCFSLQPGILFREREEGMPFILFSYLRGQPFSTWYNCWSVFDGWEVVQWRYILNEWLSQKCGSLRSGRHPTIPLHWDSVGHRFSVCKVRYNNPNGYKHSVCCAELESCLGTSFSQQMFWKLEMLCKKSFRKPVLWVSK